MTNLIDEVTEAQEYCQSVVDNIEQFLLWPGEKFTIINKCVLATTGEDSQGESFPIGALESFAKSIRDNKIWISARHDPYIQSLGRPLAAEVFYSEESREHFVAAVFGEYDQSQIPSFTDLDISIENVGTSEEELDYSVLEGGEVRVCLSPFEIQGKATEELMTDAPTLVAKTPDRAFRKSAELDIAILSVFIPLKYLAWAYLALNNPLSKKAFEVIGEALGKQIIELFGWMRDRIPAAMRSLKGRRNILEISSSYGGVKVQFLIDRDDEPSLLEAIECLPEGAQSAARLINRMEELEPTKLAFSYDAQSQKWLPLHTTTRKHGVIADSPVLIALSEIKGMSIGGSAKAKSMDTESNTAYLRKTSYILMASQAWFRGLLSNG